MRHFLLGLFLLVSLGLLGYYTLFMTDVNLFGETLGMTLETEDADGLREGDSVLLAGMRIGRVKSLSFDPDAPRDRRVTVDLILEQQIQLFEDHQVQIADATVLGGHVVRIEPGNPETGRVEFSPTTPLSATLRPDAFDALAEFGDTFAGEGIGTALEDLGAMLTELREGDAAANLNTTLDNLAQASEDVRSITDGLETGQGTIGRLLDDDSLFESWRSAGTNLDDTLVRVREGDGLVASLINDADLRDRVSGAIDNADRAFAAVSDLTGGPEDGRSSVAQVLFTDGEAGESVRRIVENIDKVAENLGAGEGPLGKLLSGEGDGGTLGKLVEDTELYDLARDILADLSTTSEQLAAGEGTLGKLIMDDSVYASLDLALRTLTRSLEDYREAAPVSVFTQTLFNAL